MSVPVYAPGKGKEKLKGGEDISGKISMKNRIISKFEVA